MLTTILQKEFIETVRDGRVRAAALVLILLLGGSVLYGVRQTQQIAAERNLARQLTREHWVNQPAKNPHSAASNVRSDPPNTIALNLKERCTAGK